MDETDEDKMLHKRAEELESAISTILFCHDGANSIKSDQSHLRAANEWITNFLSSPLAWPTSLYLSFPPNGSSIGKLQEVRFFSLNLLLSKIRNDWINVPPQDARQIYEVLLRQIPLNHREAMVGGRLCIVAAAAAALAGADTCYELVTTVLGDSVLELSLKVELLTALAEETLHRGRNLSWMVKECMQECCPQVLLFLNTVVVSCNQSEILGKMFACFERWIPAGVVLSELYTEYGSLFTTLLRSLKSPVENVFQPAVWALSELVSQVDVLPGREQAITAIIKTLLEQRWQYDAAAIDSSKEVSLHARGLCLLLSEIASIEGALLCRSGMEGVKILEWLVDASRGGGGLGLEGALMAVAAWPRLANIYYTRRGEVLQPSVFAAAAQSILQVAQYPPNFELWDDSPLEEELFTRFRTDIAEGALIAIYKELNGAFLSRLLEILRGTSTWPEAEVCLFCIASISKEVITAIKLQNNMEAASFLKAVHTWVLGSQYETGSFSRQNEMFQEMAVVLLKNYAEWIASDQSVAQHSIQFVLNSFSASAVRYEAACALKELCNASVPLLIVTWPIDTLIGNCEAALCVPTQLPKEQEMLVQVAVVQGLASVIGALPLEEAEMGLARVTLGSISTIKEIANAKEGDRDQMASVLESALNVIAGVVEYGFGEGRHVHPALRMLQEIWPCLESLTITWAADGIVATALCNLWGSVANKVGISISEVLPGIIAAASSMFKFHRVAAPLACLSKVTALVALKPTPELEKCLASMLFDVTSMLEGLDKVMNEIEQKANIFSKSDLPVMQDDLPDIDIGNSLSKMYELGQSFLVYFPGVLLPSGAFTQLFLSAIGSLNRKDPDVALAAAYFLFDSVVGPSTTGSTNRDQRGWKILPELRCHLDHLANYYGKLVVEAILRRLSVSGVVESLKEALSDVLYGFCVSYRAVAEAAIISTLSAPDFPGKLGFKLDSDKKRFLDAAICVPPPSRIRFQDLMRVFSGVCQMLLSTETLNQF